MSSNGQRAPQASKFSSFVRSSQRRSKRLPGQWARMSLESLATCTMEGQVSPARRSACRAVSQVSACTGHAKIKAEHAQTGALSRSNALFAHTQSSITPAANVAWTRNRRGRTTHPCAICRVPFCRGPRRVGSLELS
jgi:hypothetical protein